MGKIKTDEKASKVGKTQNELRKDITIDESSWMQCNTYFQKTADAFNLLEQIVEKMKYIKMWVMTDQNQCRLGRKPKKMVQYALGSC